MLCLSRQRRLRLFSSQNHATIYMFGGRAFMACIPCAHGITRGYLSKATSRVAPTSTIMLHVRLRFGLVLLEPSGLAVQNAEWQVGTLLSLSPW
jgi:hypothetical protein